MHQFEKNWDVGITATLDSRIPFQPIYYVLLISYYE